VQDAVGVQPVQPARHRQRDVLPRALLPLAAGATELAPTMIGRKKVC